MVEPKLRLASLEGWRGVMAILAVLYHAPVLDHLRPLGFFRNTFVGLEFFFVLSGFVICRAYAERVGTREELACFVIRRFGRLWPLHAFVLGVLVLMELAKLAIVAGLDVPAHQPPFTGERSIASLLSNLLLVQSLGLHDRLTWNLPSWTISVEFCTYLVFAAVVSVAPRAQRRIAYAVAGGGAIAVLAWTWSAAGLDVTYDYGIFRCLSGFFVGCLIASVHGAWQRTLRNRVLAGALEVGVILLFIVFVTLVGRHPSSLGSSLVFGAVVLVYSLDRGPVSALLAMRPFQVLGALSYSIYMLHWPIMNGVLQVARWMEGAQRGSLVRLDTDPGGLEFPVLVGATTWRMDLVTVGLVIASVAASAITYRWVEIPGRRWFVALAQRIQAPEKRAGAVAETP